MTMRRSTTLPILMAALAMTGGCGGGGDGNGKDAGGKDAGGKDAGAPSPTQNDSASSVAAASPPPAFAVCSSCHAVAPGRTGVGPSLAGVWGRKAGLAPGYGYSAALKKSGITWDAASLDRWLKGPMQMVPGTKMVIGIPNPEARKSVIDYLETLK